MKKFIIIGAVAFVAVIALAYFFRIEASPQAETLDNNNYYPIVLYIESGEVRYKGPTENNYTLATSSPIKIANMTVVETLNGKATVLLPDNSTISLEKESQITINYSETKVSIFQAFGTTYHRVEKLLTGGSYQVQTPETLAAVRGTKFGVSYNKKTKQTKVSVTESLVEVSKTLTASQGTTTQEQKELKSVKVGETAVVEGGELKDPQQKTTIVVIKTEIDTEMKKFTQEEKKRDDVLETIKKEFVDKEKIREKIRENFFNDTKKEGDIGMRSDSKTEEGVQDRQEGTQEDTREEVKSVETPTQTPVVKQETNTTERPKEVVVQQEDVVVVKKMDEEAFFTQFEGMFFKYFYIDDVDTPCSTGLSPEEKVKRVTVFTQESGYTFTKNNLLPFARAINDYCAKKDTSIRETLQKRFDEEYPFQ